jgi:hypothetical protein
MWQRSGRAGHGCLRGIAPFRRADIHQTCKAPEI